MKKFIQLHMNELELFCSQNNISLEKLLHSPKSHNSETMLVLYRDPYNGEKGLLDESPAKVLIKIQKSEENTLLLYPEEDFKQYLSN